MNALACCLGVRGFVSPPIGEALADDAGDGPSHAFRVVHAQSLALIIAKIELGQISL